jgi:hypothetical protein
MSCPNREECEVFQLLKLTHETWKATYCNTDAAFERCERHVLRQKGQKVPRNLLPNGQHLPDSVFSK